MTTRAILLVAALLTLTSTITFAQEIESLAGVRLDFERPGARALAMGGTGIAARASDAVALNPAAIAGLPRSFAIETGRRTIEGRYVADAEIHTIGLESTTTDGVRAASLTMPLAGWTLLFFYDEPVKIEHSTAGLFGSFATANLFVCGGRVSAGVCSGVPVFFNLPATYPLDITLEMQRYGAAAAWTRGPVALGGSVRREHLRQESAFTSQLEADGYQGVAEKTDDSTLAWSAGATWSPSSRARLGATYASGASFSGQRTFPGDLSQSIEFRTPSRAGVGISIDVLPRITIAADAVRVQYSEMAHSRRSVYPQGSEMGYSDVTELHAGAEYRSGKFALRAGWWRDPAHALSIRNATQPPPPFQYTAAIVDSDEDHLTAGIGFGDKTRFDASIDQGSYSRTLAFGVSSRF